MHGRVDITTNKSRIIYATSNWSMLLLIVATRNGTTCRLYQRLVAQGRAYQIQGFAVQHD